MNKLWEVLNAFIEVISVYTEKYKDVEKQISVFQNQIESISFQAHESQLEEYVEDQKWIKSYKAQVEDFARRRHISISPTQNGNLERFNAQKALSYWSNMENTSLDISERVRNAQELYELILGNSKWIEYQSKIRKKNEIDQKEKKRRTLEKQIGEYRSRLSAIRNEEQKILVSENANKLCYLIEQEWKDIHIINELVECKEPANNSNICIGVIEYRLPRIDVEWTVFTKNLNIPHNDDIIRLPIVMKANDIAIRVEYNNRHIYQVSCEIQNIIAQIINTKPGKYIIAYCDPFYKTETRLGPLKVLCGEKDCCINNVAKTDIELTEQLQIILDNCRKAFSKNSKEEAGKHFFVILNDYPEAYSSNQIEIANQLINNSVHFPISYIITSKREERKERESMYIHKGIDLLAIEDYSFNMRGHTVKGLPGILEVSTNYINAISEKYKVPDITIRYLDHIHTPRFSIPKGIKRNKFELPIGVNSDGKVIDANLYRAFCAAFISGGIGSGKTTLLNSLIESIIINYHPDDVDIWLIDFKLSGFAPYIKESLPHIKYIILDNSPEVIFDIIDLLKKIYDARAKWFSRNGYKEYCDVPSKYYIPRQIVIIDEFEVLSRVLSEEHGGELYQGKLQELLQHASGYGFHFIFANQTFSKGISGLTPTAKSQIRVRMAMANELTEIEQTLDVPIKQMPSSVKRLMETLPNYYVMFSQKVEVRPEEYRYDIQRLHTFKLDEDSEVKLINRQIRELYSSSPSYSSKDNSIYLDKKPIVIYSGDRVKLDDHYRYILTYEEKEEERNYINYDRDDILIYPGIPCRIAYVKPIVLKHNRDENILIIGGTNDQRISIVLSIINSYSLKRISFNRVDTCVEIWGHMRDISYQNHFEKCWSHFDHYSEVEEVAGRVETLYKKAIDINQCNRLVVVLGFDRLLNDIQNLDLKKSFINNPKDTQVSVIKSENIFERISKIRTGGDYSEVVIEAPSHNENRFNSIPSAQEFLTKINAILQIGALNGMHMLIVSDNCKSLITCGLSLTRFSHKIAFKVSKADSYDLFGSERIGYEIPAGVARYEGPKEHYSLRPYYWEVVANNEVSNQIEKKSNEDDPDAIIIEDEQFV